MPINGERPRLAGWAGRGRSTLCIVGRKSRHTLYEGDEGLQARLAAAKSYVAGNHTKTSPLYKDVLKIKY